MSDPYELWDGAYVLGSLSSAERREYEEHLVSCKSCRSAVAELGGMPALLGRLTPDAVAAIEESSPPPMPPRVLDGLVAQVRRRRRRGRRWGMWGASAAAAAVVGLGVLAVRPVPDTPPQPAAVAAAMTPVVPSPLAASVSLSSREWGTHVEMTCTYHAEPGEDGESGDRLAMFAVSRDGTRVQLATWTAREGTTATPSGSTSLPMSDIAAVQVVAADSGDVLLQRTL